MMLLPNFRASPARLQGDPNNKPILMARKIRFDGGAGPLD
jgi:hypothetical protein